MSMKHRFLLIALSDDPWNTVLQTAVTQFDELQIASDDQCVRLIQEQDYALVILDATYVIDVPQLIEAILEQQANIPIIVATASPTWRRAREILSAGAVDYVRKSFHQEELVSALRSALLTASRRWPTQ